jgi:hypothetical protein
MRRLCQSSVKLIRRFIHRYSSHGCISRSQDIAFSLASPGTQAGCRFYGTQSYGELGHLVTWPFRIHATTFCSQTSNIWKQGHGGVPICKQFRLGQGVRRAIIKRRALYGDTMGEQVPLQLILASRQVWSRSISIGLKDRRSPYLVPETIKCEWTALGLVLHKIRAY